jgi:hypothetical protein
MLYLSTSWRELSNRLLETCVTLDDNITYREYKLYLHYVCQAGEKLSTAGGDSHAEPSAGHQSAKCTRNARVACLCFPDLLQKKTTCAYQEALMA